MSFNGGLKRNLREKGRESTRAEKRRGTATFLLFLIQKIGFKWSLLSIITIWPSIRKESA